MKPPRFNVAAFSLLEVIIAVAIFAAAVSAMLGLLPALTRQSAVSTDTLAASRLPDALRGELQRMATAGGFDALADQMIPLAMPLPDTCRFVATRDGARLHALTFQPPPPADRIADDAQYYLVETWSFNAPPLAFEAGGAVLALHVRVSWPFRLPASLAPTAVADREQLGFNLALNR